MSLESDDQSGRDYLIEMIMEYLSEMSDKDLHKYLERLYETYSLSYEEYP